MKKNKHLTKALFMLLAILLAASCSPEPSNESGSLRISLESGIIKGIDSSISMETAEYEIRISKDGSEVISEKTSASSYSRDGLATGTYSAMAYALNSSGDVIGQSESKSFTVYPSKTSSVTLVVSELAGTGSISLAFHGLDAFEAGTGFSVVFTSVLDGSLGNRYEAPVTINDEGVATATAELANGFYAFGLDSTDDAGDVSLIDTVRIVKGDSIETSYTYSYEGDGTVSVVNNILATPSIEIEADGEAYPITISSSIENLAGNVSYAWYMDGFVLAGESEASLVIDSESGIAPGEHKFMLLVLSETGIVWTSPVLTVDVPPAMTVVDLAGKDLDNGVEITITPDEEVMVKNVNLKDGIIVTKVEEEGTKGISAYGNNGNGNNGNGNGGFKTQTGDYMLSPDKNMNAYFNGSNLGAKNNLRLKIKKFKNIQTDLAIRASEYAGTYNGLFEEFYYVDINEDKYDDLDKKNVVVLCNEINVHYTILRFGKAVAAGQGCFDMSEDAGFGLYAFTVQPYGDGRGTDVLFTITSAIPMETANEITGQAVLKSTSRGYNKLTISTPLDQKSVLTSILVNSEFRHLDGSIADDNIVPVFNNDASSASITYYFDNIEEDLLFSYKVPEYIPFSSPIVASFEAISETEIPELNDIADVLSEKIEIKATSQNGSVIYAYTCSSDCSINIQASENCSYQHINFSDSQKSKTDNVKANSHGYIVVSYTGAAENQIVATISDKYDSLDWLEGHHGKWIGVGLEGEELNNLLSDNALKYAYYIDDNKDELFYFEHGQPGFKYIDTSFNGVFISETEIEGYGTLAFKPTKNIGSSLLGLSFSTNGNVYDPRINAWSYDLIDTNKSVLAVINEFWLEDGIVTELLCEIIVGNENKENKGNIRFFRNQDLSHDWQKINEGKAVCKQCGEERSMMVVSVNPNEPKISFSGLRENDWASFYVEPAALMLNVSNSEYQYPDLTGINIVSDFDIWVIAPTADSNIKVTEICPDHDNCSDECSDSNVFKAEITYRSMD